MNRAPDVYTLSVRDPAYGGRGGPVAPASGPLSAHDLAIRYRHALFVVHGFNNTQAQAEASYQTLIDRLMPSFARMGVGRAPDVIVRVQWPGDAAVGPISALDFIGYPVDIDRAREAAIVLQNFLAAVRAAGGAALKISVIAHSLGCRLMLELLTGFVADPYADFELLVLMAPAVPVDLVDASRGADATLAGTNIVPRHFLKFHSLSDVVLQYAFPAGQELAWNLGIEAGWYVEAVGRHGDPPAFANPQSVAVAIGHGDYWADDDVRDAILIAFDPATRGRLPPRKAAVPRRLPAPYDRAPRDTAG